MKIYILIFSFVIITQSIVAQDFSFRRKKKYEQSLRLTTAAGYAYRLGKVYESGYSDIDQLSEDIRSGLNLDCELQYFFHKTYGLGLIVNYVRQSVSGKNITIPYIFYPINLYKESQGITFVGPAFIFHNETENWLCTLSAGVGPIFLYDKMQVNDIKLIGTSVNCGIHTNIGLQYKFSYDFAAGLKFSITGGYANSINIEGEQYDFSVPFSLANIMLSANCSFRLK